MNWTPGDLAVVHLGGGAGRFIDICQRLSGAHAQRWEHAIVGVGDGMIVEAEQGGAQRVLMHYDERDVWWCWQGGVTVPAGARAGIVARADKFAADCDGRGTPYSDLDYLAQLGHCWHIPFPGLRHFIADDGHVICSQLDDCSALAGGWHLFTDKRWPGYVRPYDLAVRFGAPGA
jgi:hypothetical protein